MDDDIATSNESDTETCMVVEIQENELGEIVLVERPREQVFADGRFCVVDCKVEPSEAATGAGGGDGGPVQENIEIVYLPDYGEPPNGPVPLKQEMLLNDQDYDLGSLRPATPPPKVYRRGRKRTTSPRADCPANPVPFGDTRLRSNPNVTLRHGNVFRPRDRSWTLKLNAKDFAQTKSISSVTTIHTNPKGDVTVPESRLAGGYAASPSLLNTWPHKCQYCDRAFRQSVSLQIHSTLHRQSIPDGCHVS